MPHLCDRYFEPSASPNPPRPDGGDGGGCLGLFLLQALIVACFVGGAALAGLRL